MTPELEYVRPDRVEERTLRRKATLLVGGPGVGKSRRLGELDVPVYETLGDVEAHLARGDPGPVALDDLYPALQRPEADEEALRTVLDQDTGVCVATRVRDLDWLCQDGRTAVTAELLDAFDTVLIARYDPDDDLEAFLAKVDDEWTDDDARSVETGITERSLRAACEDGLVAYEPRTIDHEPLRERLDGALRPTLVPGIVSYLSYEALEEAVLLGREGGLLGDVTEDVLSYLGVSWGETARGMCGDLLEGVGIEGITDDLGTQLLDFLDSAGLATAGLTYA